MHNDTEIVTGTKQIRYRNCNAFLPVLIVKLIIPQDNKTIRQVHLSTVEPMLTKEDALEYADKWRKESLAAGHITYC